MTVSLSKISKNEIVKMRRRAPIIYGMNRRGRRSDASSDAQPVGTSPLVQSIKCAAARGNPLMIFPPGQKIYITTDGNVLHKPSV